MRLLSRPRGYVAALLAARKTFAGSCHRPWHRLSDYRRISRNAVAKRASRWSRYRGSRRRDFSFFFLLYLLFSILLPSGTAQRSALRSDTRRELDNAGGLDTVCPNGVQRSNAEQWFVPNTVVDQWPLLFRAIYARRTPCVLKGQPRPAATPPFRSIRRRHLFTTRRAQRHKQETWSRTRARAGKNHAFFTPNILRRDSTATSYTLRASICKTVRRERNRKERRKENAKEREKSVPRRDRNLRQSDVNCFDERYPHSR